MSRAVLAVVLAVVLTGCGVSAEDEPQPIDTSSQEPLPATPSFDTETSPAPPETTSPSSAEPPPG